MAIFEVESGIFGIDLYEEGRRYRSSAYVILDDEGPVLVDPGSARSHGRLVAGLQEVGLDPQDLRHVVATHAHLDHAGGAGQLMARATGATLHCHPRAAAHLIDPGRLQQGARAVYGDALEDLFGPLLPIPAQRVVTPGDGESLVLHGRALTFYDAPGHAKHHLAVVDSLTRGLFSGDAVGIR